MKDKLTLILFVIGMLQTLYSQDQFKIDESNNSRLIKILNNSELIGDIVTDYVSVRIYKMDNGSGSAGHESCEVSFNLLVAVSEFGEYPNQNLFEIGQLYNPKFINWNHTEDSKIEFQIEHGNFNNRKTITLAVNVEELKLIN